MDRETDSEMTSAAAKRIASLDPVTDCQEIARLLMTCEFSWDIERALEFALFRTYAVPSISGLLARTGEFECRPRKRYDDTELILSEMIENGFDSAPGRCALARMNDMHSRYRIANEDMLYVLSTFVFEPIRWVERFGRRPMTEHEMTAWFHYHRELGHHMGISGIPADRAALEVINRHAEEVRFKNAESNRKIGSKTRDLLLSFYLPRWLFWSGRSVAYAFMDAPLLRAMGFPAPPASLQYTVMMAMRLRQAMLRCLPARRRPRLLTKVRRRTYPEGYRVEELGTFRAGGGLRSNEML